MKQYLNKHIFLAYGLATNMLLTGTKINSLLKLGKHILKFIISKQFIKTLNF